MLMKVRRVFCLFSGGERGKGEKAVACMIPRIAGVYVGALG